ncbi:MAG: hypothetical protein BGO31_16715 [Bacteroidetes bacterium 43-16]|nr:MAG: hypothetical protein BGO31_16715 [Bacteroidetes bacterium 43-16]
MHFRGQRIAKEFYEKEFSATVVNFSNWQGRSTDFYLNNKITLNFSNPVDGEIEIGDSIRKSSNTYIYSIYRKQTEGSFELIGTYDYRKRK